MTRRLHFEIAPFRGMPIDVILDVLRMVIGRLLFARFFPSYRLFFAVVGESLLGFSASCQASIVLGEMMKLHTRSDVKTQ